MQQVIMSSQMYPDDLVANWCKLTYVYDEDKRNYVFGKEVNSKIFRNLWQRWAQKRKAYLTYMSFYKKSLLLFRNVAGIASIANINTYIYGNPWSWRPRNNFSWTNVVTRERLSIQSEARGIHPSYPLCFMFRHQTVRTLCLVQHLDACSPSVFLARNSLKCVVTQDTWHPNACLLQKNYSHAWLYIVLETWKPQLEKEIWAIAAKASTIATIVSDVVDVEIRRLQVRISRFSRQRSIPPLTRKDKEKKQRGRFPKATDFNRRSTPHTTGTASGTTRIETDSWQENW